MGPTKSLRAAILCCEDAEKWEGWTERLWRGRLEDPGDTFTVFRCYAGEFPDPLTVRQRFDVLVIGGSHHSAYDQVEWIRRLESLLPAYVAAGVRLVGCCFGHQILSQALGGRVGRNPSGRFVLGVESVAVDTAAAEACGLHLTPPATQHPQPPPSPHQQQDPGTGHEGAAGGAAESATVAAGERAACPAGEAAAGPGREGAAPQSQPGPQPQRQPSQGGGGGGGGCCTLRLLQSHGDQVLELPSGATLLASSGTAAHEMWSLPGRVLSFQFHPELTPDLVYDKIWGALAASGRLSADEAAAAAAQLRAGPGGLDVDVFVRALNAFVRAPLPPPPQPDARTSAAACAAEAAAAASSAAAAAAEAAEAAAGGGTASVAKLRQALEAEAGSSASRVAAHVRAAAAAGLAAGTAGAELLTALNTEAAAAYGRAADAAEGARERVAAARESQARPLQAALASLGALEAQLDRLAEVVGQLEAESRQVEAEVAAEV